MTGYGDFGVVKGLFGGLQSVVVGGGGTVVKVVVVGMQCLRLPSLVKGLVIGMSMATGHQRIL